MKKIIFKSIKTKLIIPVFVITCFLFVLFIGYMSLSSRKKQQAALYNKLDILSDIIVTAVTFSINNYDYGTAEKILTSFFSDEEPEEYFSKFKIVRKDKIITEYHKPHSYTDVRFYYYLQKE